jgi:hypothetical protein
VSALCASCPRCTDVDDTDIDAMCLLLPNFQEARLTLRNIGNINIGINIGRNIGRNIGKNI